MEYFFPRFGVLGHVVDIDATEGQPTGPSAIVVASNAVLFDEFALPSWGTLLNMGGQQRG
jgi:hypothetical protein